MFEKWKKKTEANEFMDAASPKHLTQPPARQHYILWAIAGLIVVGIIWASFSEIDEVTTGTGKVIPSSKIQVIQHLEGGIVEKILVREGQIVKKGQILMEIDDITYGSLYREGLLKAAALKAKITRLSAEAKGTEFIINAEFAKQHPNPINNEKELFEANQKELQTRRQILHAQVKQREQELASVKAKAGRVKRSHALVAQELKMTSSLLKEGAASKVEVLRLERQVNDLAGELQETELLIKRIQQALVEANGKLDELEATMRSKATRELAAAKAQLATQEENNRALKDRASRTILRAPVTGIVKVIYVNTIGGAVKPGMDLMEIVPTEDTLLIEAKIRPSDVAFLHPGQDALVKLTAYDFLIYGGLKGKVEHISADTIADKEGRSFYLIRVRTDKNFLGSKDKPLPIIPGMTAEVDILTGKKTVISYILKPLLRGQQRALRER